MQTTKQWWDEVSNSPEKMIAWLKAQYHGEVTAEGRMRGMIEKYDLDPQSVAAVIVNRIADDEKRHAEWVGELLYTRGITAEVLQKEERYWNETLPADTLLTVVDCHI